MLNVVIVDYGLGNLFSVKNACQRVGVQATVASSPEALAQADAVILPGVGAFPDAMQSLERLHLADAIKEAAHSGKPLVGICLGMQLLMTESHEFGSNEGLGIIQGPVVRLDDVPGWHDQMENQNGMLPKIPQVGWNRITKTTPSPTLEANSTCDADCWAGSPLESLAGGEYMYFVHSYVAVPENAGLVLSTTRYGNIEFCSSFKQKNVFGCQFHPERSGDQGLEIYRCICSLLKDFSLSSEDQIG